jgi:hypothetical protein
VLPCRWFPEAAVQPVPEAKYLDLILYSREQLLKEYQAMPSKTGGDVDPEKLLPNVPWGIIRWDGELGGERGYNPKPPGGQTRGWQ